MLNDGNDKPPATTLIATACDVTSRAWQQTQSQAAKRLELNGKFSI
jgi:hypothetical protein